jgi:hypothetical protein
MSLSSHSPSALSFYSSPSTLASIALSTTCISKNAVKNIICPFKKACTGSMSLNRSIVSLDNGMFPSIMMSISLLTYRLCVQVMMRDQK